MMYPPMGGGGGGGARCMGPSPTRWLPAPATRTCIDGSRDMRFKANWVCPSTDKNEVIKNNNLCCLSMCRMQKRSNGLEQLSLASR